jgi:hypothetical protein
MNTERPPLPEAPSNSSKTPKRTLLDRVFRHLPAGSRRVAGAMALGAMEMMSDNVDSAAFQKADTLSQAQDIVQEERKERLKRDIEADKAIAEKEIEELRRKINNG